MSWEKLKGTATEKRKIKGKLECKHGILLYGTRCINCGREEKEVRAREESRKRIIEKAKNLGW